MLFNSSNIDIYCESVFLFFLFNKFTNISQILFRLLCLEEPLYRQRVTLICLNINLQTCPWFQSLLQHFEQTLTEAGQEDNSEPDYEDQQSEQDQSHRSRLQDLLLTARKRSSGCFGARMDRIGNASGLGCNIQTEIRMGRG
uniref:Natriuretic peptide A n=1 Tax=Sphaeramia orbicularis TaxID=375764 RepID=A0A673BCN9_9TELE